MLHRDPCTSEASTEVDAECQEANASADGGIFPLSPSHKSVVKFSFDVVSPTDKRKVKSTILFVYTHSNYTASRFRVLGSGENQESAIKHGKSGRPVGQAEPAINSNRI